MTATAATGTAARIAVRFHVIARRPASAGAANVAAQDAQDRVGLVHGGVVGRAHLRDQPAADPVQLGDDRVDHVDGVGGAAAGVRLKARVFTGGPHGEVERQVVEVGADCRQGAFVRRVGGHGG
jgi:hypothetical protein